MSRASSAAAGAGAAAASNSAAVSLKIRLELSTVFFTVRYFPTARVRTYVTHGPNRFVGFYLLFSFNRNIIDISLRGVGRRTVFARFYRQFSFVSLGFYSLRGFHRRYPVFNYKRDEYYGRCMCCNVLKFNDKTKQTKLLLLKISVLKKMKKKKNDVLC